MTAIVCDAAGRLGRARRPARAVRGSRRRRRAAGRRTAHRAAARGGARRIVVSDTSSQLFSGPLGAGLDVRGRGGGRRRRMRTASAEDVLDGLPEGLDAMVAERGRSFSGGQRQRLVLARALATDPEVLVLVEPTRAVDAHTEARIAVAAARPPRRPDDRGHHGQPAAARRASTRSRCLVDGRSSPPARTPTCSRPTPPTARRDARGRARRRGGLVSTAPARRRRRRRAPLRRATSPAATRGCSGRRARACTCSPPLPGWPRRACSAAWCRRSRTAPPVATSTGSSLVLAGFLVAADGADPLRALPLAGARRAGARRAARGLRRERARAAGRHGRVGRLRRPADPHQPRRRPARLVGALGAARVDHRGGHRGADLRRRAVGRLVGVAPLPARACRRW